MESKNQKSRSYETPVIQDLGSLTSMTRGTGGAQANDANMLKTS